MKIITETICKDTKKENEIIDITKDVEKHLIKSQLSEGIITLFVKGSTAALTTIEHEPGLIEGFPAMFEKIASDKIQYKHDQTWHDGNGHSHVRASLLGPSLSIPFSNSQMFLGTWQQIILIEFDIKPRTREIVIQIFGE